MKTGSPILPLSAALFLAADPQVPLHCKLNFQVVSGNQLIGHKKIKLWHRPHRKHNFNATIEIIPFNIILCSKFEVFSMNGTAV